MKDKLEQFYSELKQLMNKHELTMECMDNYDGNDRWCGQTFTLRSREAKNGRYEIYMESLEEFVDKSC